jgi:branched-subunit amino acid transport protein
VTAWVVVVAIGVGTFLLRFSFIAALGRLDLPEWVPRALRFVPPAVLAALTLPAVAFAGGELALAPSNERLMAAILATLVVSWTKNAAATIATGMTALWILQALT